MEIQHTVGSWASARRLTGHLEGLVATVEWNVRNPDCGCCCDLNVEDRPNLRMWARRRQVSRGLAFLAESGRITEYARRSSTGTLQVHHAQGTTLYYFILSEQSGVPECQWWLELDGFAPSNSSGSMPLSSNNSLVSYASRFVMLESSCRRRTHSHLSALSNKFWHKGFKRL